jgi:UDP-N-acetyl-D-mannosaminuronic acid dehydrogenase
MNRVAVIGCGRVGLPLALALTEAGVDVVGIDQDLRIQHMVNWERTMPFLEPGFEDVLTTGRLQIHHALTTASDDVDSYIICIGSPYDALAGEVVTAPLLTVANELGKRLRRGDLVVFRSTLASGLGDQLHRILREASGLEDFAFAYCPERLTEGHAREELKTLPQMIGADDDASAEAARNLFGHLGMPMLPTAPIREVELAKLFCNAARYAEFAVANSLFALASGAGVDPHRVFSLANAGYPRPIAARPGLTAGPCLRKDWGLLTEGRPEGGLFRAAWRTNEDLPRVLVAGAIARVGPLADKRVGVLGLAFKANSDDVRDSLALKLCRLLLRECPTSLLVHDPVAPQVELSGAERVDDPVALCRWCDVIFVATPHSQYRALPPEALSPDTLFVDVWGVLDRGLAYIG